MVSKPSYAGMELLYSMQKWIYCGLWTYESAHRVATVSILRLSKALAEQETCARYRV